MDTSQWMQGNGVVENSSGIEKKTRPPKEEALNCPRCNSVNTKFCYYNNYSLSQPRYFCKTCRRYWTSGGSLRNVPVGGGSRKNRRPSSSISRKAIQNLSPPKSSTQDSKIHQGHDLNLGYNPSTNGISEFVGLPFYIDSARNLGHQNPNISCSNNFIPMPNISLDSNPSVYNSSGFSLHDIQLKPNLNFTFDGNIENGYGNTQGVVQDHTNSSRILNFPFEDLKPNYQFDDHQERGQGEGNGNWNGMLAGGSW